MYTSVPCVLEPPTNVTLLGNAIHAITRHSGEARMWRCVTAHCLGRDLDRSRRDRRASEKRCVSIIETYSTMASPSSAKPLTSAGSAWRRTPFRPEGFVLNRGRRPTSTGWRQLSRRKTRRRSGAGGQLTSDRGKRYGAPRMPDSKTGLVIDSTMMVDIIVTSPLVVYAVMMIIVDVRAADHGAGDAADNRARRSGDHRATRRADDGAGHRAGQSLSRNANNSANRCKGQQKSFHVGFSCFQNMASRFGVVDFTLRERARVEKVATERTRQPHQDVSRQIPSAP